MPLDDPINDHFGEKPFRRTTKETFPENISTPSDHYGVVCRGAGEFVENLSRIPPTLK
jgi:hypothetical protein